MRTERLLLRDLRREDASDIYRLFPDARAMHFLDLPHPNIAHSRRYIAALQRKYRESPRRCWKLAVVLEDTQTFLGVAGLAVETSWPKDGRADLEYYFLPEFWRMGYATEAGKALIKFGFETLSLNKITAGCLQCNTGSEKVMIRCGMQREAEFRRHTQWDGEWVNRVEYAILRDEYERESIEG